MSAHKDSRCDSGSGRVSWVFLSYNNCLLDERPKRFGLLFWNDMARDFARSFYSSKAWQDCRYEYAKSVHYLCENCMRKGIYRPGVIVHHIEELTPANIHRPEITLNFDNLELLCRECHAEQHTERSKGRRYIYGDNGEIILK